MSNIMKNKRIKYLILFIIIFIIEVFIGVFVKGIIRDYVGDILVMPAMYFFIKIIYPKDAKYLPYILFVFASFVELLQYLNLLSILNINRHSLLGILLGSTGDIKDVLCYLVGTILIIIYEKRNESIL